MRTPTSLVALFGASLLMLSPVEAALVRVTVRGDVTFNWMLTISSPPLGIVQPGESVTSTFLVDTDESLDNAQGTARAYRIVRESYSITFDSGTLGLQKPFPEGLLPYFVVRQGGTEPDGFHLSMQIDVPTGVPLSQGGALSQFRDSLSVPLGAPLASLDVLDALGDVEPSDLSNAHWVLIDGPFEPLGMGPAEWALSLESGWVDQGCALAGAAGLPHLAAAGDLSAGSDGQLTLLDAAPQAPAALFLGLTSNPIPFKGGTLKPDVSLPPLLALTSTTGSIPLTFSMPSGVPASTELWAQWAIVDAGADFGVALSNAVQGLTP